MTAKLLKALPTSRPTDFHNNILPEKKNGILQNGDNITPFNGTK
jgi:hypothetical protein